MVVGLSFSRLPPGTQFLQHKEHAGGTGGLVLMERISASGAPGMLSHKNVSRKKWGFTDILREKGACV